MNYLTWLIAISSTQVQHGKSSLRFTEYGSLYAYSEQVWQIWLAENTKRLLCACLENCTFPGMVHSRPQSSSLLRIKDKSSGVENGNGDSWCWPDSKERGLWGWECLTPCRLRQSASLKLVLEIKYNKSSTHRVWWKLISNQTSQLANLRQI